VESIETESDERSYREEAPVNPGWRFISTSVRGSSHEHSGLPCQDKHRVRILENEFLLIAIADGAGFAKYSDLGAEIAVQATVDWFEENRPLLSVRTEDVSWNAILSASVGEARQKVLAEASRQGVDPNQLASTLIVVVAAADFVACGQVGDGAAVIRDQQGVLFPLTIPIFGECINETTFLTSLDALNQMQLSQWRGALAELAVFSDGVQMLCLEMPKGVPHQKFFVPLFRFLSGARDESTAQSELREFLSSDRIRRYTDDDITLVLAVSKS
jgi:hypothetical protein